MIVVVVVVVVTAVVGDMMEVSIVVVRKREEWVRLGVGSRITMPNLYHLVCEANVRYFYTFVQSREQSTSHTHPYVREGEGSVCRAFARVTRYQPHPLKSQILHCKSR